MPPKRWGDAQSFPKTGVASLENLRDRAGNRTRLRDDCRAQWVLRRG